MIFSKRVRPLAGLTAVLGLFAFLAMIVLGLLLALPGTAVAGPQPPAIESAITAGGPFTPTDFAYLPMLSRPHEGPCRYLEQGGVLIIEVESVPPVEAWTPETAVPGFTGSSYYTWLGPDHFGTAGVAVLAYPLEITTPGHYNYRIHNYHDHPDSTLENDVFTQLDGGGWVKAFSSINNVWTWEFAFDYGNHDIRAAEYDLTAGQHTLYIAARSHGFSIDRIALWQNGGPDGRDTNLPPSACVYSE